MATTVAVQDHKLTEVKLAARAYGMTITSLINLAIDEFIEARRFDDAFQNRLTEVLAEDQAAVERLGA